MLASAFFAYAIGFDTEEVYASVVVVYAGDSLGSGFAIGENCIITNAHVIGSREQVTVQTYAGERYRGFVVSRNETIDIAVIGVSGVSFLPLQIADLDRVKIGDDVYAIGAPNSLAYTLTKGVVSSKDRTVGMQRYIQTDAAINTGNSGGPLLNDAGEVIGVNSYKMSDAEGIGLAIPIDVVTTYLETGEIDLGEDGNVVGVIEEPPEPPQTATAETEPRGNARESGSAAIPLLATALGLSAVLNIILFVLLMLPGKKQQIAVPDPSERTDFEIEILDEGDKHG